MKYYKISLRSYTTIAKTWTLEFRSFPTRRCLSPNRSCYEGLSQCRFSRQLCGVASSVQLRCLHEVRTSRQVTTRYGEFWSERLFHQIWMCWWFEKCYKRTCLKFWFNQGTLRKNHNSTFCRMQLCIRSWIIQGNKLILLTSRCEYLYFWKYFVFCLYFGNLEEAYATINGLILSLSKSILKFRL